MRYAWLALIAVFVLPLTARVHAGCGFGTVREDIESDRIAVVFTATVRDVKSVPAGQIVTFAVDRVWKGNSAA
jgi:hypothetical protein